LIAFARNSRPNRNTKPAPPLSSNPESWEFSLRIHQ
jgi:hypothetical protein